MFEQQMFYLITEISRLLKFYDKMRVDFLLNTKTNFIAEINKCRVFKTFSQKPKYYFEKWSIVF